MKKNIYRLIVLIAAFILSWLLLLTGISYYVLIPLVLIMVIGGYFFLIINNQKKRTRLLHHQCDPGAFLAMTYKQSDQMGQRGNQKVYFAIDQSQALCLMNRFNEALEALEAVDLEEFRGAAGWKMIYHLNLVSTYLGLGRFEEAVDIYDEFLAEPGPVNPAMQESIDEVKGDILFYSEENDQALEMFERLLEESVTALRKAINTLRIAQIKVKIGEFEEARRLFGNLLSKGYPESFFVVKEAWEALDKLDGAE